MELLESRPGNFVRIATTFNRPVAGNSSATFRFTPRGDDATEVTWVIEGTHSYLARAVSLVVGSDRALGPDMERGLRLLKASAERPPAPPIPLLPSNNPTLKR